MPVILIGGGTGLIGTRISDLLAEKNYEVRHLSRTADNSKKYPQYEWNTKTGYIDEAALEGVDYVINLAGAGIVDKRWTDERKEIIIKSRTETTDLLRKYIENGKLKLKAYVSASAIGYYGDRGNDLVAEDAKSGDGFLSESVRLWEEAIEKVENTNVRTVWLRVGIVLSKRGGALPELMKTFPLKVGAYFGNGSAYYSWIHIDDMARMFIYALETEEMEGAYNGATPNPHKMKDLIYKIKEAYGKFVFIAPAPEFGIKLALGEMASTVLNSTRVSNKKITDAGFKYQYPELVAAVKDVLKREV